MITKNQTLLEKAKSISINRIKPEIKVSKEDEELVEAFLREQITLKQVHKAKNFANSYQALMYIINVIKSNI